MIFSRFFLAILVFLIPACTRSPEIPVSAREAADRIQELYERRSGELKPQIRAHFKLRLYRSSGDSRYREDARGYAQSLRSYLEVHQSKLAQSGYIEATALRFLSKEGQSPKHQMRRRALEKHPLYPFYHRLVYLLYQSQSLGLDAQAPEFQPAMQALRAYNFRGVLMDEAIITYHAAEAANTVYYLKSLKILDMEQEFSARFRQVFMNGPDERLGRVEYENKLYGLTHIVIAASDYYQHVVPVEKFSWVLDYFSENIDMILIRAKWDVIAEVGLCFRLAGIKDHPVLTKTREAILRAFDPKQGMIPGKKNPPDLNRLEHRNILSYLLLKDWEKLYPGPDVAGTV